MVAVLVMSAKLATLGLLKLKVIMSQFLSMALQTKFYHVTQIIL